MTATLEFWYEFASTYSYPAAMQIDERAGAAGVGVVYRPFLLGPIFGEQGWSDSPFNIYPAKGRYMWRDLARLCDEAGLPLVEPSAFPRNGLHAARIACAWDAEPWMPDFTRRTYTANFALDRDIGDREVLAGILEDMGLAPDEIAAGSTTPEAKAKLRAQTERAAELGIFGAPTFAVGPELFWGGDRLDAALAWARRVESGEGG